MPNQLTHLSPTAAKIYLLLSTLTQPHADPPVAQVPLTTLARLANLAPRTCSVALRHLLDLQMLTRLPRRNNAPTAYILAPLHYAHPDAPTLTPNSQPIATLPTLNSQPAATPPTPNAQPHAPGSQNTPISTPKTNNAHPHAPHVTSARDSLAANPALLQLLLSSLASAPITKEPHP